MNYFSPMPTDTLLFSPGQRVLIRDAEWRVRRVDATTSSHFALSVTGVSEIVRGREAVFLTAAEKSIEVLDPATTKLVTDDSHGLTRTRLHLESLLRQIPPTGPEISLGHRAAMDTLPFQLAPTDLALRQPRQRILIADSVGLGKTLEAGILVAELARRGRAQRILVVTAKSLLTQFQKEWWSRFTLPLVRLDSIGLQRVRNRIPTHQNPFYFYDRSIISIDTLKQDNQFRNYLEQAYWDVIVIDEAHNVAKRGGGNQRNRLADLLATRSDTLVLLSATPHDGRKASFASLMNLLDATAIADPDDYGPEDIRGLFVRRFRKDVSAQLKGQVPERILVPLKAQASGTEQTVFDALHALTLSTEEGRRDGSVLFRTTLLKSFLSSPMACASTLRERLRKLEKGEIRGGDEDTLKLTSLLAQVDAVTKPDFTKYQALLKHLKSWKPSATDRVVIFTERIQTLDWLQEQLLPDLKLKASQISRIDGGMDDIELMKAVEEFGQEDSPVRLLVASDVAAEGINLHYQCHRLVHFDLPWSLMVFSQRNGRVDRYGQKHQPELAYLITASQGEARSDERVLEVLLQKDKQAQESIGDPSALLGCYTQEEQEAMVSKAIQSDGQGLPDSDLGFDPFELLLQSPEEKQPEPITRRLPSLFESDFQYCTQALKHLAAEGEILQYEINPPRQEITISITRDEQSDDLYGRYRQLPPEILPDKGGLHLSANPALVMQAIESARKEGQWPQTQYLWPLHPVVEWINDRVLGSFGRHEAPVVHVPGLGRGEALVLISGLVPNRLGHPLVHQWVGALFRAGSWSETLDLEASLKRCGLNGDALVNATVPTDTVKENLVKLLVPALACGREAVEQERKRVLQYKAPELAKREARLLELSAKHDAQIELKFSAGLETVNAGRKHEKRDQVRRAFDAHRQWLRDAHDLEPHAHLQVLAVCCGRP